MLKWYFKPRKVYYLGMEKRYRPWHQCNIKSEMWNQ